MSTAATPIAVVTADNHLKEMIWANRPELRGDAYHGFQQVIDLAIQLNVPVLAAGDLIDKRLNESAPLHELARQLNRLTVAGLPFIFIQGQHELQPVPWALSVCPAAIWLKPGVRCSLAGFQLRGLDWQPAAFLPAALADPAIQEADVLLMHQLCEEFMGGVTATELSFNMVPASAQVLVVGDYHKHLTKKYAFRGEDGIRELKVFSPGSTVLTEISEEPTKQVFVLDSRLRYRSVALKSRQIIDLGNIIDDESLGVTLAKLPAILDDAHASAALMGLPDALRRPIVKVSCCIDVEGAHRRLRVRLQDQAHLFLSPLSSQTKEDVSLNEETRQAILEGGLQGALNAEVSAVEQPALHNLLSRLLAAADVPGPEKALLEMREEFFRVDGCPAAVDQA